MWAQRTKLFWVFAIPAVAALYYLAAPPNSPLFAPDSIGYIQFDASRPIGYPVLLFVVHWITGDFEAVRFLQIVAFCFCTAFLGAALLTYTKSAVFSLIAQAGILGHPGPIGLANVLISDSLSASTILLYAATLILFCEQRTLLRYSLICVVAAVAVTLRPVNLALLPPTLLLPFLFRTSMPTSVHKAGSIFVLIMTCGVLATPIANWIIHGSPETSSPLARGLFQKVMFLAPQSDTSRLSACDADYIQSTTSSVYTYLQNVPAEFQDVIRYRYSQFIRFSILLPGLERRHASLSSKQRDDLLMCYTWGRLKEKPAAIFEQSIHEYWNLIANYSFITHVQQTNYSKFIRTNPPVLPVVDSVGSEKLVGSDSADQLSLIFAPPQARPLVAILVLRVIQILSATVSVFGIFALVKQLQRSSLTATWSIIGVIGVALQLYLWIVAVVEIAEARYLFSAWSLLWLTLVLTAFELFSKWNWREV